MESYRRIVADIREVDGDFCCIIHNQNLCELGAWKGWRHTYDQMLDIAKP